MKYRLADFPLWIQRFKIGSCLFTQSHADHLIGLQDDVLYTGVSVLNAGDVCDHPQVRKLLYK